MPELRSHFKKFVDGITIFSKYNCDQDMAAERDTVYAGPDPELVSEQDLVELEAIGWYPEDDLGCFYTFV